MISSFRSNYANGIEISKAIDLENAAKIAGIKLLPGETFKDNKIYNVMCLEIRHLLQRLPGLQQRTPKHVAVIRDNIMKNAPYRHFLKFNI